MRAPVISVRCSASPTDEVGPHHLVGNRRGRLCTARSTSYASSLASVEPISAGVGATAMPAALSAAILSAAAPLPPEMIAPACPIRLPGGGGWPPVNAGDRVGGRVFVES